MKNPPHPGELLREDILAPLGLSVKETAARLGMSRVALSRVLNGHAAISPDWPCAWSLPASARRAPGSPCRPIMTWPGRCGTNNRRCVPCRKLQLDTRPLSECAGKAVPG